MLPISNQFYIFHNILDIKTDHFISFRVWNNRNIGCSGLWKWLTWLSLHTTLGYQCCKIEEKKNYIVLLKINNQSSFSIQYQTVVLFWQYSTLSRPPDCHGNKGCGVTSEMVYIFFPHLIKQTPESHRCGSSNVFRMMKYWCSHSSVLQMCCPNHNISRSLLLTNRQMWTSLCNFSH